MDATNNTGQYTSTAIDGMGNVYVSYYDATATDVKLASAAAPYDAWTVVTVESANNVGQYSSLAQNAADGSLYVAYYDATNANLRFAYAAVAAGPGATRTSTPAARWGSTPRCASTTRLPSG